jgi:hypothetical protein
MHGPADEITMLPEHVVELARRHGLGLALATVGAFEPVDAGDEFPERELVDLSGRESDGASDSIDDGELDDVAWLAVRFVFF